MKKLLLILCSASLVSVAQAQTPAAPAAPGAPAATPAPPAKPLGMADKKFIKDLSEGILIEQKYLDLVKDPKKLMVSETSQRDIGKMASELKRVWTALATLATAKGAEVASEVAKSDLAKIEKLTKEKPDKFEKEFFKDLGRETGKTAKLFDQVKSLQDPEVKVFAEDWGTVIKGHDKAIDTAGKASGKK